MTANQIAYWRNRREIEETERSNRAKETETQRSNLAKEAETQRSNIAREEETHRSNVINEAMAQGSLDEVRRENLRKEYDSRWNRVTNVIGTGTQAIRNLADAKAASSKATNNQINSAGQIINSAGQVVGILTTLAG